MAAPDPALERDLAAWAEAVAAALGARLVCCAAHGSVARDDFVAGRSDVNTVVVAEPLDATVLAALAPVVHRFARRGFALPLVIEPAFLDRARDVFPIELDDLARHHRLLAGRDVLADVRVDAAALRRQCEHEARALVLRLRAMVLGAGAMSRGGLDDALTAALRRAMVAMRHLLRLRDAEPGTRHADHVAEAERMLGPLPALRRLSAHRDGTLRLRRAALAALVPELLADAERLAGALDALDA